MEHTKERLCLVHGIERRKFLSRGRVILFDTLRGRLILFSSMFLSFYFLSALIGIDHAFLVEEKAKEQGLIFSLSMPKTRCRWWCSIEHHHSYPILNLIDEL